MKTENTSRPVHGGNLVWAAQVADCSPDLLLDFSASISPLGPPQSVLSALTESISALRHYPNPDYSDLRSTLAAVHHLSPSWILPGNGSAELLTWACRDFAGCATVCLPTPAFGDYFRGLKAFDVPVSPCPLPLQDAHLTEEYLTEGLLTAALGTTPAAYTNAALGAKASPADQGSAYRGTGLLINNPHNPSGCLFSRRELLPLLEQFELVVVDEAFMDFLPPDQQESLVDQVVEHDNLVILRSLTKFYSLPGLRLGYAIAHPDRLRRWQQWRDPWPVNTLAAAAAIAAVQDEAFQQQSWAWLAVARPQLYDGLKAIDGLGPLPGAANYLLVRSHYPVPQLQEALLQQHQVFIRDCLSFEELCDRYFRIAVRTVDDNQRLLVALADVIANERLVRTL